MCSKSAGHANADLGTADDHAIDVAADPAARDAEAELATVPATGAEVEPGRLQPANGQILELVTGVEDPKQSAAEFLAAVHWGERDLIGESAGARLADPAAAEVVAWRLGPVRSLERCIDVRVDPDADVAHRIRRAIDEAGPGVQVDDDGHRRQLRIGRSVIERLALHRLLEAIDRGLDQLVDLLGREIKEVLHQTELGQDLSERAPASLIACCSMSVLSIIPLCLPASAAPAPWQRSEQKR